MRFEVKTSGARRKAPSAFGGGDGGNAVGSRNSSQVTRGGGAATEGKTTKVPAPPRLIVALDTNEIINLAQLERLTASDFLQDCPTQVEILLPKQVVNELDGLKCRDDPHVAVAARRANAFLSEAASRGSSWLICEQQTVATLAKLRSMRPDERVLRCVQDFISFPARNKLSEDDRVILATCDQNLQLQASMIGIEAKPLRQIRREAATQRTSQDPGGSEYGSWSSFRYEP